MFKILRQLLFAMTILAGGLLYARGGARGPESGGGGGVVYLNEKPHLIDFYTIPGSAENLEQKYSEILPSRFNTEKLFNFDQKSIPDDAAFHLVLSIFKQWSDLSYDTIGLYINVGIFSPVRWNFTDSAITSAIFYRPQSLPNPLQIKTAAYYLMKDETYQVSLSREIWNQLAIQDQVGLLIHETLRHIQIGRSFSFDDEALQKATAVMLSCKPSITLDQYLFFLLHNRRDIAEQRFEKFERLTKDCGRN